MSISHDWTDFCDSLDKKKVIQAPFCGEMACEDKIKKDSARYSIFLQYISYCGNKSNSYTCIRLLDFS